MSTLPIRFLTDEDSEIYGPLSVALGKLARAGLPVIEKLEIDTKKFKIHGVAFYDHLENDVTINIISGKPHPKDLKKISEIVLEANKKLFIPHVYEWIVDGDLPAGRQVKLSGISPYTPVVQADTPGVSTQNREEVKKKSAVKVFLDLSEGVVVERDVDGVYLSSNDNLIEVANTFSNCPVLVKIDHNLEVLDFVRHNKNLTNVHIVISGIHSSDELMQVKRDLAVKRLARKNSLQHYLELAIPENIINLEDYLLTGLDGVVINLDQLIAYINGFDLKDESQAFYKKQHSGLLKFLEDSVKLLHKSNIPFLASGSIVLESEVLEFLVEKGVYGIIANKSEAHSMTDHLHQAEKRMILKRAS